MVGTIAKKADLGHLALGAPDGGALGDEPRPERRRANKAGKVCAAIDEKVVLV